MKSSPSKRLCHASTEEWTPEKELTDGIKEDSPAKITLPLRAGVDLQTILSLGWTYLHLAAIQNSPEAINTLCLEGVSLDTRDMKRKTALHYAAGLGNSEAAIMLILMGARTDLLDENGFTALHLAARYDHAQTIKTLVLEGYLNVNALDLNSNTPLHIAAQYGCLNAVEALIELNANLLACNSDSATPLKIALAVPHIQISSLLLKQPIVESTSVEQLFYPMSPLPIIHPAPAPVSLQDQLHQAIVNNKFDLVVKMLHENDALKNQINAKTGNAPCHVAAQYGRTELIKLLVSHYCHLQQRNAEGKTALSVASENGHIDSVMYLLSLPMYQQMQHTPELGSELATPDNKLFWTAIDRNNISMTQQLIAIPGALKYLNIKVLANKDKSRIHPAFWEMLNQLLDFTEPTPLPPRQPKPNLARLLPPANGFYTQFETNGPTNTNFPTGTGSAHTPENSAPSAQPANGFYY